MKYIQKHTHSFLVIFFILFMSTPLLFVSAQTGGHITNPIKDSSFAQFVNDILGVVIQIGYVVVVFFIVYSGFLFVSARGSEEKLTKAKTAFLWTCIGAAILLGAKVLENAVQTTVTSLQS